MMEKTNNAETYPAIGIDVKVIPKKVNYITLQIFLHSISLLLYPLYIKFIMTLKPGFQNKNMYM